MRPARLSARARGRPPRRAVYILLAFIVTALPGCTRRHFEAVDILMDLRSPDADEAVAPVPIRYSRDGRHYRADLHASTGGGTIAAIVLVPGVAAKGKDDPRLLHLARMLTRAGFDVLVPDIPNLRALEVRPGDARHIADAVLELSEHGGGGRCVGLAAVSYAVGPAVLAALDPRVRDRVAFVLGIGGYYDLSAMVTFLTTGHYRGGDDLAWRRLAVEPRAKWLFALANAGRVQDPGDRDLLRAMARRKLAEPTADIADLATGLGTEGTAVHALLENTEPGRVAALIAALPAAIRADLEALDLSARDLRPLAGRLILIHGRDDRLVPADESRRLAAAVGPNRAEVYLVDALFHADLDGFGVVDALTLWDAVVRVLRERDRMGDTATEGDGCP